LKKSEIFFCNFFFSGVGVGERGGGGGMSGSGWWWLVPLYRGDRGGSNGTRYNVVVAVLTEI
jgi:hypothetical protein